MSETHMDLKAEEQPTTDYVDPESTGTDTKETPGDSPATDTDGQATEKKDGKQADDHEKGAGDDGKTDTAGKDGKDNDDTDTPANSTGKKQTAQQRIDELTKKWRTAERERDTATAELNRMREGQTTEKKDGEKDSGSDPAPRPKEEDFETWEDYEEAVMDWKLDQREEKKSSDKIKTAEEGKKTADDAVNMARLDVVMAKGEANFGEDFKDIVTKKDIQISQAMVDAALSSTRADEILYFLGTNPEEAAKIAGLSPLAAARAIGTIEEGLARQVRQTDKRTTNAPAPIKPLNGNERTTRDPSKMSMAEYAEARDRGDI